MKTFLKAIPVLAASLGLMASPAQIILTDSNPTVVIGPGSQPGVHTWTVDGEGQSFQQTFWARTENPGASAAPIGTVFTGEMSKIFGANPAFSAKLVRQLIDSSGETTSIPGRIAALDGKSRYEIDSSWVGAIRVSPEASAQMKAMGMDQIIMIVRPDLNTASTVYPRLHSYTEHELRNSDAIKPESDFAVETTELGKETVDNHPCIRNKLVITSRDGTKHEFMVWNAIDLKEFPVKVQTVRDDHTETMLFKDVKLDKPEPSLFTPPSDFRKYDNLGTLMQREILKRTPDSGIGGTLRGE